MTKKVRKRYTAEFKAAAVARLDEAGETLSSVSRALELCGNLGDDGLKRAAYRGG